MKHSTRLIGLLGRLALGCNEVISVDGGDDFVDIDGELGRADAGGDGDDSMLLAIIPESSTIDARIAGLVEIPFEIERRDGLEGPVVVTLADLPEGISAAPVEVAAGETAGVIAASLTSVAIPGLRHTVRLRAASSLAVTEAELDLFVLGRVGDLDRTLGDQGIATLALPEGFFPIGVVSTGNAVFAGGVRPQTLAIVKLTVDGEVDSDFGSDGVAEIGFTDLGVGDVEGAGLEIQSNGRLVVLGSGEGTLLAAGFSPDGAADPSFGDAGRSVATLAAPFRARGVAVGSDDSITIAGCTQVDGVNSNPSAVRLSPDGSIDNTFGDGGMATAPLGDGGCAFDLDVQQDGSVLALASRSILKLGPHGELDQTFGAGGSAALGFLAFSVAVTADGITIGGTQQLQIGVGFPLATRLDLDGHPVASFGAGDGEATLGFAVGVVLSLHPTPQGVFASVLFEDRTVVMRILDDGTSDLELSIANTARFNHAVALDHSRLLLLGTTTAVRIWL